MAKGPEAFRTISEAADELNVPQHVLRFWETRFSFIKPMKRAGGRRFYRPHDIAILRGVRRLLHDEGYTIKGVQRLQRESGLHRLISAGAGAAAPPGAAAKAATEPPPAADGPADQAKARLADTLDSLESLKQRLDALLKR